jgi:3-methylfumaryl-CoA hydratase
MNAPGTARLADWIGRTETRRDVLLPSALDRLAATLDRDDPPAAAGDAAPPLAHWILFLDDARQSALGPDGHAARGGFLPPVHHLSRRMWAGSRLAFPGPLPVGVPLERRSTIVSVAEREGRSGPLVFVTVRHEIGEPAGRILVTDEHDIVYAGGSTAAKASAETVAPSRWQRTLTPDPVLLFRYSALTFNGHRIHYDAPYATAVEGYPGLVVHGPLLATLLLDLVRREAGGAVIDAFSFRAVAPAFAGAPVTLHGTPAGDRVTLVAAGADGRPLLSGEATLA